MSNGNDWQGENSDWQQSSNQPANSAGGQQLQPQHGGAGGGHGGGGGGYGAGGGGFQPPDGGQPLDAVTEGWGGGPEVTLDEVIARLKLVASRAAKGPVLMAWLAVGVAALIFPMLDAFMWMLGSFLDSLTAVLLAPISIGLGILGWVVSVAAGALQLAMFKPLHRMIFEGEHHYAGPMDVINEAKGRFVPMLIVSLILMVTIGLGSLCCLVPGLFIAFVTCQAPYLVATQGVSAMDAIKRSFTLNKTYWMPVLIAIAALFVISGVAGCFVGAGTFIIGFAASFISPFDMVINAGLYWLFIQAATFGIFLVHTALFSTLETKETGKLAA